MSCTTVELLKYGYIRDWLRSDICSLNHKSLGGGCNSSENCYLLVYCPNNGLLAEERESRAVRSSKKSPDNGRGIREKTDPSTAPFLRRDPIDADVQEKTKILDH